MTIYLPPKKSKVKPYNRKAKHVKPVTSEDE
jgi:hypothetical protein